MEDKTFELITTMYSDITKRLDGIDSRLGNLEEGQKGLSNDTIRTENKLDTNSKALFDGYGQVYEKLEDIEEKVDTLTEKVDSHDNKIQVIEGARR